MSTRLQVFRVGAFSARAFAGNPAAVVPDAAELTTGQMQAITREQGGTDTAFILPPDAADHDVRVRFFTPRTEAGFIGHATLAVHAVLEALGRPPARRQKQRAGIVDVERLDGAAGRYAFSQAAPPVAGRIVADRLESMLEALGLRVEELDAELPAVIAGSGSTRALIAIRAGARLTTLRPDLARLAALSADGGPSGYFLYTLAPAVPGCDTEARMFCPAIGIAEDPVSGNAHAMLASWLQAQGRWPRSGREKEFTGKQGHHIGRPGTLLVRAVGDGRSLRSVRVAGDACIVMRSELEAAA